MTEFAEAYQAAVSGNNVRAYMLQMRAFKKTVWN
jgi:hypothetical protein